MATFIRYYSELGLADAPSVGSKNAFLGELFQTVTTPGMQVPDGFAITGDAFMEFLRLNNLEPKLLQILDNLDRLSFGNLARTGETARTLLLQAKLPETLAREAAMAYRALADGDGPVVVRSSALSDDDPAANFAGLHDSFRNVRGEAALLQALKACFASVFNNRAIKYRQEKGFLQEKMSLAIGVQRMVRADLGGSGVAVTLDPETGFRNVVHISAIWGLGENMTHGSATPDEYRVFKPNLARGYDALLRKELGGKEHKLFFDREGTARNTPTPEADRARYVLSDEQAEELARCCVDIEARVGRPMDIEWAIDGSDDILYLLQARPETVQSAQNPHVITVYHLERKGLSLTSGQAIGMKVVSGKARILQSQREPELQPGEIIVTDLVHPDWEPVLELAAAVVTNKGGRTSHASIMARELGIPAVVGCGDATERITDGEWITVSCCEGSTGNVYRGIVPYVLLEHDFSGTRLTAKTRVKLIAGDPDSAFRLSFYPNDGVGLMRLEFLIGHCIRIHPMALVRYEELPDTGLRRLIDERTTGYADKKEYFVDQLAQGIAVMAAAFYPKEVIVRTSDLKTNEYAGLIGGAAFEPQEENPMLGFRGAARYYHPLYEEGFALECAAIRRVRSRMGLTNVKVMVPFCRTVEEAAKVVSVLAGYGLDRCVDESLQLYMMAEIPANVLLAEEFARHFDGFSIGSNDLTQLTLGIDRGSALVAGQFSEQNEATRMLISQMIAAGHKAGKTVGLCGQAPSDDAEFVRFLVEQGIDSISFNPDSLLNGIGHVAHAEALRAEHDAPGDPSRMPGGRRKKEQPEP